MRGIGGRRYEHRNEPGQAAMKPFARLAGTALLLAAIGFALAPAPAGAQMRDLILMNELGNTIAEVVLAPDESTDYRIQLARRPTGNVTVNVDASGTRGRITVIEGGSLTFNQENRDTPRTVTLTSSPCAFDVVRVRHRDGGGNELTPSLLVNIRERMHLAVNSVAGDNVLNIAEHAAGFNFAGTATPGASIVLPGAPSPASPRRQTQPAIPFGVFGGWLR